MILVRAYRNFSMDYWWVITWDPKKELYVGTRYEDEGDLYGKQHQVTWRRFPERLDEEDWVDDLTLEWIMR